MGLLTYAEKHFLEGYRNDIIRPIGVLIEFKEYVAAAKLILSGIDAYAGLYCGRVKSGLVGGSFKDFVEKYLKNFDHIDFSKCRIKLLNRNSGKIIYKPSEILYDIFRNHLIHDSSLGIGVGVYYDKDIKVLWHGSGIIIMEINILGFFEYFKKAIGDYERDVDTIQAQRDLFIIKYNDLNYPTFGEDL